MKKRTTKRIAVFLATAMLSMQVTSVTAFAQEPEQVEAKEATSSTQEISQFQSENLAQAFTEKQPEAQLTQELQTLDEVQPEAQATQEPQVLDEVQPEAQATQEPQALDEVQPEAQPIQDSQAPAEKQPEVQPTQEPQAPAEKQPEVQPIQDPQVPAEEQPEVTPEEDSTKTVEKTENKESEDKKIELDVDEDDLIAVNSMEDSSEISVQAGNADLKNQLKTSDGVEVNYDITSEDGIFKIYYDIGDGADGDVVLDFSMVIDMINEWYRNVTGDENAVYKAQPSDYGEVDIEVTSSNGHTYRYKDGSFRLETADTSKSENLTDFVGFDGQKLPVESLGAIARSTPMTKLFGVFSSREVNLNLILEMKDYLEKAGYTGETALTDYMLDYYNKELGTSYSSFTELAKEHPEKVVDMQGGMADDQYYITEDQYNNLLQKYPDLMGKYAISEVKSNGKVMVQLKWPEKELAEVSYELFYKELLSFSFGDKASQEEFVNSYDQWHKQDLGLKDYMDDTNGTWTKVNDYLKQATAAGLNKEDATKLAISMAFGFDGPWTTNSYQFFKYAWYNSIVMEQVDGEITINKVDKVTGELIKNPANFKLFYYKMEQTDDGSEKKVTYYYAIDENGKGYFTEDESKAAVLITEDGSLTIKYLLPDYEYHLKETKAPEGYEVSDEDTVISVKSKENTVITVKNGKPTPTPTPKPSEQPTPTPKPSENPTSTPKPSEQPAQTPAPTDTPKQTPAPTAAPAVKNTSSPQTGDTSNIEYMVFTLIASSIGLAAIAFARRRKQK